MKVLHHLRFRLLTQSPSPSSTPQVFMDNQGRGNSADARGQPEWLFGIRFVALVFSFVLAQVVYYARDDERTKGIKGFIEGIYFTVVTITTIGYGDVVPNTGISMLLTVILVLIAIGAMSAVDTAIDWVISKAVLKMKLDKAPKYIQIVSATIMFLVLVIGVGVGGIFVFEHKEMNSNIWYFNAISLMTVGYGDFSFKSSGGQVFASFYLLIGPRLVARYIHFLNSSWRHWKIGPNLLEREYHTRTTLGVERTLTLARERRQELQLAGQDFHTQLRDTVTRIQQQQQELQIVLESLENIPQEYEGALDAEIASINNLIEILELQRFLLHF
ncbi:two-pore potassium channel 3-like [Malus sylvestris]|uniref:two-pore potassium channel 3-like n=1 Tax=Malus sylvestris TaxID=3752 RepID=UPI0021ACBD7B|nr:two-pore potassium channel 3-like [Malus sylvestris]